MKNLNLLVVEGNIQKENDNFRKNGIQTHAESLKDSLQYYTKDLNIDVFNLCSEKTFDKILPNIKKYDGLIWGGSSLNIYNDCIEIRRQISFMKECFKSIKKINLNKLSRMALEDPSTATNPKKMTIDDMKILYEHSISGKLF